MSKTKPNLTKGSLEQGPIDSSSNNWNGDIRIDKISDVARALIEAKDENLDGGWDKSAIAIIGAGVSVSAGIPTAENLCKELIVKYPGKFDDIKNKNDYAKLMEKLRPVERRKFLLNHVSKAKINASHLYLAHLVKKRFIGGIITTNFDLLALQALGILNVYPAVYDITTIRHELLGDFHYPCVVHLHGQMNGYFLLNLEKEMKDNLSPVNKTLEKLIDARPVIVIGYSGNDPVFDALMQKPIFNGGLFWVNYKGESPIQHVKDLFSERKGGDISYISEERIDADTFFVSLNNELGIGNPDLFQNPLDHLKDAYTFVGDNLKYEGGDFAIKTNGLDIIYEAEKCLKNRPVNQVEEAQNAWRNAQYDTLERLKEVALKEKNPEVLRYVAFGYFDKGYKQYQTGLFEQALESYNKGLEIAPNHSIGYYNRGLIKIELGLKQEALNDFNKSIDIDPTYSLAYYSRGALKSNLDKIDEAIIDVNRCIYFDPNYTMAYNLLGSLNFRLKKYEEAISNYTKAIGLDPNNKGSYYDRALVKYNMNDYLGSIEDYNRAIDLDSDFAMAYNNRGSTKADLGLIDDALNDINHAIRLEPNNGLFYNNRSALNYRLKKFDSAISDIDMALKINPDDVKSIILKGIIKVEINKKDEALIDYNLAIEKAPNYSQGYNSRGYLYAQIGNFEQALLDLNKAIDLESDNPNIYHSRGFAYSKMNKSEEAFADFAKAIELDPNLPDSYFDRAELYHKLGKIEEANADMKKALELKPDLVAPDWYKP